MNKINNKKGISLIVLVITIIVMIVLATAIILSLQSSGIIGRANEAREDSDNANLAEAAGLKLAEYELAVQSGEINPNEISANDYVKSKLENMDVSKLAISKDGEILTGLSKIAVEFVERGVNIGDEVTNYILDTSAEAKSYTTSGKENTADTYAEETDPQSVIITRQDDDKISWRYFGIDENGDALIVANITSDLVKMRIGGKSGWLYGPDELNKICKALYSSNMGTARSINVDDVTRVLEYTGQLGGYRSSIDGEQVETAPLTIGEIISQRGEPALTEITNEYTPDGKDINTYKSNHYDIGKTHDISEYNQKRANLIFPGEGTKIWYWLADASTYAFFDDETVSFLVRSVNESYVDGIIVYDPGCSNYDEALIRPVVALSDNVKIDSYTGSSVTISLKN